MAVNPNRAQGSRDCEHSETRRWNACQSKFCFMNSYTFVIKRLSAVSSRTKDQNPARTVYFLIENICIKLRKQRRHRRALKPPLRKSIVRFDICFLNIYALIFSITFLATQLPAGYLTSSYHFNPKLCLGPWGAAWAGPCSPALQPGYSFWSSFSQFPATLSHLLPARSSSLCLVPFYVSFRS